MPESFLTAFIHLAIVLDVTCPCASLVLTHSFSSAEPDQKVTLALIRFLMASIGHNRESPNFLVEMDIQGLDRCVLRDNEKRVDNEKRTPSSEKTNDFRSIAAISATLKEAHQILLPMLMRLKFTYRH
jgi:hypothetical protein